MTTQYISYSSRGGGSGSGVTAYADLAAFPVSADEGAVGIALDTGIMYEFHGAAWVELGVPAGGVGWANPDLGSVSPFQIEHTGRFVWAYGASPGMDVLKLPAAPISSGEIIHVVNTSGVTVNITLSDGFSVVYALPTFRQISIIGQSAGGSWFPEYSDAPVDWSSLTTFNSNLTFTAATPQKQVSNFIPILSSGGNGLNGTGEYAFVLINGTIYVGYDAFDWAIAFANLVAAIQGAGFTVTSDVDTTLITVTAALDNTPFSVETCLYSDYVPGGPWTVDASVTNAYQPRSLNDLPAGPVPTYTATGARLPAAPTEMATKGYVDSLQPTLYCMARALVDTDVNSPATDTFDDYAVSVGAVVWLATQTNPAELGYWVFNGIGVPMTRDPLMPEGKILKPGQLFYVHNGSQFGHLIWTLGYWSVVVGETKSWAVYNSYDSNNVRWYPRTTDVIHTGANVDIANPAINVFDGVTDPTYVFLNSQTDPVENGLYAFSGIGVPMVRAYPWRAADIAVPAGTTLLVLQGTENANSVWTVPNTVQCGGSVINLTRIDATRLPLAGGTMTGDILASAPTVNIGSAANQFGTVNAGAVTSASGLTATATAGELQLNSSNSLIRITSIDAGSNNSAIFAAADGDISVQAGAGIGTVHNASNVTVTSGSTGFVKLNPHVEIGDMGLEGGSINVNGLTFTSTLKVSDIDGSHYAQTILHRHSTTLEPLIVGARSYTDDNTHANVLSDMNVFTLYGSGWAGSSYKLFGQVSIASDSTGTISNTSAPGKIVLSVTPNGSIWPVPALTLANSGAATFASTVSATGFTGPLTGDVTGNVSGTAANVTGTVAIANGGTGATTKAAAFDALSPMTTAGDLILGGTAGTGTRLAIGSNTYVLTSNGTTASWQAPAGGGPSITGTRASPSAIVAGTGIAFTGTNYDNTWFISGSGGAVTVTANPQIAAATNVGQRLTLIGRDDTNTVTLSNGTGLDLNGSATLAASNVLSLIWDGTNWVEVSRSF